MTNEFKNALDGLQKAENGDALKLGGEIYARQDWCDHHLPAIHRALLIADKLMQEPSEVMCMVGVGFPPNTARNNEIDDKWYQAGLSVGRDSFKAMRDQMLKEVWE